MFNPLQSIFGKPKGKGGTSAKRSKSAGQRKHHAATPRDKAAAKGQRGASSSQAPPAPGLSLDRRLDIAGIVLVFIGLISFISLFTQNQSAPLQSWVKLLGQIAGWGKYALPLGFILIGGWIVLRKFGDQLPKFELERPLGVILLYLALLITMHFFVAPSEPELFPAAQ